MIVTTIVVATRSRTSRSASVSDAAVALPRPITPDATLVAAASIDAAPPPVDAGVDARPSQVIPVHNIVAEQHLAAAEEAKRSNNRIGQLVEAKAAFEADPRSVRARFLLADALLEGGDLDRGCKHLRALGKNPAAQARARAAGCPTD
jgi:thioredoxin-like negative regulator of GroEL